MNTPKLQLNKTICDTKFVGNFEGWSGWKGRKGTFLTLCFSVGAAEISRISRARG